MKISRMKFFDEPDKDSGKVTFKYQDQVVDELDWNTPEDRKKIIERAHRGIMYDKNSDQYHAAVKFKEQFDTIMEEAGQDDQKFQQLVGMIEGYTGRKMTVQEKVDLSDDVGGDDADENPLVKKLSEELGELRKSIEQNQERELAREIDTTHKVLAEKYDGANGRPKYDPDAVANYISKNQFYLPDIRRNYEEAYFLMNRDEILKAERENAQRTETERKKEMDEARSPKGGGGEPPKEQKKPGSWDDIVKETLRESKEQGKSFVVSDS